MMTERRQDPDSPNLFVVRLWAERFDQRRWVWRGEVVDSGSGARRYFARWEDLLAFLCEAVGVPWEGFVAGEITTEVIDHEQTQRE